MSGDRLGRWLGPDPKARSVGHGLGAAVLVALAVGCGLCLLAAPAEAQEGTETTVPVTAATAPSPSEAPSASNPATSDPAESGGAAGDQLPSTSAPPLGDRVLESESATRRLNLVVIALIGLAVVIAVATALFWRATRPSRRAPMPRPAMHWLDQAETAAAPQNPPSATPFATEPAHASNGHDPAAAPPAIPADIPAAPAGIQTAARPEDVSPEPTGAAVTVESVDPGAPAPEELRAVAGPGPATWVVPAPQETPLINANPVDEPVAPVVRRRRRPQPEAHADIETEPGEELEQRSVPGPPVPRPRPPGERPSVLPRRPR